MSYERLKAYFYTSAQGFCAILALFRSLKDQYLENCLKNRGDHLNVLYLVFYELSHDVCHLFLN